MNAPVSKKTKISCRLHRWLISFLSEENIPAEIKKNHHVSQCPDCQRHYELWQQLQAGLYKKCPEEDQWVCGEIMAQIESQAVNSRKVSREPALGWFTAWSRSWLWLAAGCSLLLVATVMFWNLKSDPKLDDVVESVDPAQKEVKPVPENQDNEPSIGDDPWMRLAALQKEQGLIASDLAKFKTMLNQRVIIFHEE